MKKLIYILLCALLVSCGSVKKIFNSNEEKSESKTVRTSSVNELNQKGEVIYKTAPVYYQSVIEKPCDEFGNLLPINTTIGSGGNKATIKSENGQLIIEQVIDSTISSLKSEYREKFVNDSLQLRKEFSKMEVREKEVVRTVWPWWLWTILILSGLYIAYTIYIKIAIPLKL